MLVMNSFREITNTAWNSLYMECEEQLLLALSLPLPCCGACVSLPASEAANHPSLHWRCRAGAQSGPPACNELTTPRDGREGSPWQCSDTPESCKSCRTRCWLVLSLSLRDSVVCQAMPGVPGKPRGKQPQRRVRVLAAPLPGGRGRGRPCRTGAASACLLCPAAPSLHSQADTKLPVPAPASCWDKRLWGLSLQLEGQP